MLLVIGGVHHNQSNCDLKCRGVVMFSVIMQFRTQSVVSMCYVACVLSSELWSELPVERQW